MAYEPNAAVFAPARALAAAKPRRSILRRSRGALMLAGLAALALAAAMQTEEARAAQSVSGPIADAARAR